MHIQTDYKIPVVGYFEKVSFEQFQKDIKVEFGNEWNDEEIRGFHDSIKLPRRATTGSAGYDFFSPIPFVLDVWDDIKIPTGVRVVIEDGWYLACHPRSGLGFKQYLRLANTTGIIDSDYARSSNEGHIWAKVRAEYENAYIHIHEGEAFMQGIFMQYGLTMDDDVSKERNGGLGSTSIE